MKPVKPVFTFLKDIEDTIDRITHKMEALMATAQNFKDLVQQLNDETNTISARIDALIAKLNDTGISSADEDAALAELQAVSDRLKTLGADQTNPIP